MQEAPVVPATIAPATEPESKPDVQGVKPSDAGKEGTGAVNEPSPGPTQDVQPPADNDDNANSGGAEVIQERDKDAAVEEAGFVGSPDVLVSGLSRLMGRGAPNYKADVAIFASILSLALAGVWIEWRLLSRRAGVILVRTGCILPISTIVYRVLRVWRPVPATVNSREAEFCVLTAVRTEGREIGE